jgi:hypothetical protein
MAVEPTHKPLNISFLNAKLLEKRHDEKVAREKAQNELESISESIYQAIRCAIENGSFYITNGQTIILEFTKPYKSRISSRLVQKLVKKKLEDLFSSEKVPYVLKEISIGNTLGLYDMFGSWCVAFLGLKYILWPRWKVRLLISARPIESSNHSAANIQMSHLA